MTDLRDLIARNRRGEAVGLPCFCTANEHVLRAVLSHGAQTGFPVVIEATCNQVNQDGGYTGMTAADFMGWVGELAQDAGVPTDRLILGGDHLGPNPWRAEPVEAAMAKARELVKSYAAAGFRKIHLDASMACGGEPDPTFEQIAARAADLCTVAEAHAPDPSRLIYIIGTEVPVPGGETHEPDGLDVTSVDRFRNTISTHRAAFAAQGLDAAWGRIVSVVTQPGVDFSHSTVYPFAPDEARPLGDAILSEPGLTFEAHSTDYQATRALAALVAGHFFFLKVGPELTFRLREAVWALAGVEAGMDFTEPSQIREVLKRRMQDSPNHWRAYYTGSDEEIERLKIYSYSDRIRYYWSDAEVSKALCRLIANLANRPAPDPVLSQSFMGLEFGDFPAGPDALIETHINRCVARYYEAAGWGAAL